MTTRFMRNALSLTALLAAGVLQAQAAEAVDGPQGTEQSAAASPSAGSGRCAQLRAQIAAQTEILLHPNIELLSKVGANGQCHFTSAETYRAAWGAKPFNPPEPRAGKRDEDH